MPSLNVPVVTPLRVFSLFVGSLYLQRGNCPVLISVPCKQAVRFDAFIMLPSDMSDWTVIEVFAASMTHYFTSA